MLATLATVWPLGAATSGFARFEGRPASSRGCDLGALAPNDSSFCHPRFVFRLDRNRGTLEWLVLCAAEISTWGDRYREKAAPYLMSWMMQTSRNFAEQFHGFWALWPTLVLP